MMMHKKKKYTTIRQPQMGVLSIQQNLVIVRPREWGSYTIPDFQRKKKKKKTSGGQKPGALYKFFFFLTYFFFPFDSVVNLV